MAKLPGRLSKWNEFIDWYGQSEAYWYFPKGRSVQSEDIIEAFRILKNLEGTVWRDSQADYLNSLETNGLFTRRADNAEEQDRTAMARMWKQIFSMFGFAWIEEGERVAITPAGEAFLTANDPVSVVEKQVQRFQLTNPTLRTRTQADLKIRPHIFLLDVLLNCERYISKDEYVLFVGRARDHSDIDRIIEYIEQWRELPEPDKILIKNAAEGAHTSLTGRRSSLVNTIALNRSYALGFLTFCSYLTIPHEDDVAVRLRASAKYEAEEIVRSFRQDAVFIEFRNAKDWFAYYGDCEKFPSTEEALDYYSDTSQTELLHSMEGNSSSYEAQFKEKILEDHLEKNIEQLESGLTLVGRQYSTVTGPIDLLCKDKDGDFVVVELKKDRLSDKVVGQILRYMGFVGENLIEHDDQKVRGIIVGRSFDKKLEMAVQALKVSKMDIQVKTFDATVTING